MALGAQGAGAGNCANVTAAWDLLAEAVDTASVSTTNIAIIKAVDLRICTVKPVMFVTVTVRKMRTLAILITHLLPGLGRLPYKHWRL